MGPAWLTSAFAAALLVVMPGRASVAAPIYSIVALNAPNGTLTQANGINDAGQVVGYFTPTSPATVPFESFVYDSRTGSYSVLSSPTSLQASSISGTGTILGVQFNPATSALNLFTADLRSGLITPFGEVNNLLTAPNGINASGQIAGYVFDPFVDVGFVGPVSGPYTLFRNPVQATGSVLFQGINDAGQIVGYYTTPTFVPPRGIGSGGTDFGFVLNPTTGVYTVLSDPLASSGGTEAYGINNLGQVVGTYVDGLGSREPFLYDPLTDSYTTLPSLIGYTPRGINDAGQIVASGTTQGILATPIGTPEPASLALLGGLSLTTWLTRRRRRG